MDAREGSGAHGDKSEKENDQISHKSHRLHLNSKFECLMGHPDQNESRIGGAQSKVDASRVEIDQIDTDETNTNRVTVGKIPAADLEHVSGTKCHLYKLSDTNSIVTSRLQNYSDLPVNPTKEKNVVFKI